MTIVVAYGNNFVMGNKGGLPGWKLPKDMFHFKNLTMDNGNASILIMGRKTFESFPEQYRPLPDRYNFILSRRGHQYIPQPRNPLTFVHTSFIESHSMYRLEKEFRKKKVFVIGGAEIYKEALILRGPWFVNEIIATEVDGGFEGDTFFPAPNYSLWQKEVLREVEKDEKNSHNFKIVRYIREAM